MSLDAAGKGCRIEVFADDEGVRLICNTVGPDACPLSHPGELGLDCFRGVPAAPDSHMVVEAPHSFPNPFPPDTIVLSCANAYRGHMPEDRELQECATCRNPRRWCFAPKVFSTGDAVPYGETPFQGVRGVTVGGMIRMPDEEKQEQEKVEEEDMFEEAPALTPPKKDIVVEPNDDDDAVADAWFEQVIEEFDSTNEYAFGLVCVKDDEGDVIVTLTIDNVNIDIRLEDFIELAKALRDALPKLKAIYMEE